MLRPLFCTVVCSIAIALCVSATEHDFSNTKPLILMRHALAPGFGDPEHFELRQRSTQRNLSTEGREQAERAGEVLRKLGISSAQVYTSQWFRCLDTAALLGFGTPHELPALNSFFQQRDYAQQRTTDTLAWLKQQGFDEAIILVTHQVNITALTGIFPASGEILFFEPQQSLQSKPILRIVP